MFGNLDIKQNKIIVIFAIIIAIGIVYFVYKGFNNKNEIDVEDQILVENNNNKGLAEEEKNIEIIVIHVAGAVKSPGIVKIAMGSRIEDAIEAAGGLSENADISNVNLAYVLDDGSKITIPTIDDIGYKQENIIIDSSGENVIDKMNEESLNNSKSVNINKANELELESLPGIGASLALRIITYREQNGKFNNIEDIKNVNGIGDSKYENIKNFICVK